jgi:5-methylcytosine-specific restriction endonuclease McrA
MIWIVITVALGLALGVGVVLVLVRPVLLHSAHKRGARRKTASLKPVAPPLQVGRSQDKPPEVDRPVDFLEEVVKAAWRRQGGLCANCGRLLIWTNRDRDSGTGAWQSHHRTPRDQGGSSNVKNCVLFCSGIANCHFNIGHGGIGWNHYSQLEDSGLPYLRHGSEEAKTTAPQTRTRPSLIGKVFGVLLPARAKKHSASKPNANRPGPSLPLQDDYDGSY